MVEHVVYFADLSDLRKEHPIISGITSLIFLFFTVSGWMRSREQKINARNAQNINKAKSESKNDLNAGETYAKSGQKNQEPKPPPAQEPIATSQVPQAIQPFPTMKQYKIYQNPSGLREAVKQGWSWPAFLFTWVWAFIKKMNPLGGLTIGVYILLAIILGSVGEDNADAFSGFATLVGGAIAVVFAVNGNTWREKNLLTRGYAFKSVVEAETDEGALAVR